MSPHVPNADHSRYLSYVESDVRKEMPEFIENGIFWDSAWLDCGWVTIEIPRRIDIPQVIECGKYTADLVRVLPDSPVTKVTYRITS